MRRESADHAAGKESEYEGKNARKAVPGRSVAAENKNRRQHCAARPHRRWDSLDHDAHARGNAGEHLGSHAAAAGGGRAEHPQAPDHLL